MRNKVEDFHKRTITLKVSEWDLIYLSNILLEELNKKADKTYSDITKKCKEYTWEMAKYEYDLSEQITKIIFKRWGFGSNITNYGLLMKIARRLSMKYKNSDNPSDLTDGKCEFSFKSYKKVSKEYIERLKKQRKARKNKL